MPDLGRGRRNGVRLAVLYAGAAAGGALMAWVGVPLPWMIGSMAFAAAAGLAGLDARIPVMTRQVGQTVVAGAVGLFFTPAAVASLVDLVVPMVAMALLTIAAGLVVAAVLMRLTSIDPMSAAMASIPGGPVEMAELATLHNVPPGPVAFAQILRIALLISVVPSAIQLADGSFGVQPAPFTFDTNLAGTLLMLVLCAGGALLFRALRIPSPYFLGALASGAGASALSLPVAMPPAWVISAAQVLLGVWLGSMFDRGLLSRSRGFVTAAFASTMLLLGMTVAMAVVLARVTGLSWQSMVLATAPGSVTEMALTAKLLDYDVAVVTAFHIVRIFIIIPLVPPLFWLATYLRSGRRRAGGDGDAPD